jgi:hypothetical protein
LQRSRIGILSCELVSGNRRREMTTSSAHAHWCSTLEVLSVGSHCMHVAYFDACEPRMHTQARESTYASPSVYTVNAYEHITIVHVATRHSLAVLARGFPSARLHISCSACMYWVQ